MNVLLIDDDDISNFLSERMLRCFGVTGDIYTAANGKRAIDLLNDKALKVMPDIIFVDIDMPIMDGFEFIDAFSKLDFIDRGKIRIVILSPSQHKDDIARAQELGMDYLAKPMSINDLERLLNNCIE